MFEAMHRISIVSTLMFLVVLSLLSGCGERPDEWGVLLWSEDETAMPSGSLVGIYESSQLNRTYTYRRKEDTQFTVSPQWRVEAVGRRRDAEAFRDTYAGWADRYAVSLLDGLRVREEPHPDAVQLYKLREGEVMKLIARGDESVTVGQYHGYWYEVLTEDGVRGHTFDEYLEVTTRAALAEEQNEEEGDPFLETFLTSVYRPEFFREMVETGRYDLDRFVPDYGVFPDPEAGTITIAAEDHTTTIEYERITRPTDASYAFEESSLILTRLVRWINLSYADGADRFSENYVFFPEDIETLTQEELERRQKQFETLIEAGSQVKSSAYGSITFSEDRTFLWEGYDRLVPDVIPSTASGAGVVEFPLYLDDSIAATYDGALVLAFALDDPDRQTVSVRFLYNLEENGIRFTFVPEIAVEERLIGSDGISSVILFFTYE